MLADSGLLQDLEAYAFSPAGLPMCIYGDPAYPLKSPPTRPIPEPFNASMSSVRISVEWLFGDVINYFKFLDFKKNLKIGMSSIGKMYIVCALLHNARNCLYGNKTSSFFELEPPHPPGILCLEVEKNRGPYKTISNSSDCSCDYP